MRLPPLLAVPLLCLGLNAPALAAPAIWQVSDADSKIWLFGSFHLLPEDVEWRTPAFDQAFNAAEKVYFEADIGPEAQVALLNQSYVMGFNIDGRLLSQTLNRKEMAALRVAASDANIPVPMLLTMKPWMATNTLSVGVMITAGYDPTHGVDNLLQLELPADRKAYFETGEEQLNFIAGAPEDEQIAMLNSTVDEIDELPETLNAMLDAWAEGTPETLADLFLGEVTGYEQSFVERLIYQRNRNWIAPIKTMLADNETAMVVVGTGHLVGDDSVIDLLGRNGFTVTRIQ